MGRSQRECLAHLAAVGQVFKTSQVAKTCEVYESIYIVTTR
jgi:hypothetical protein